MREINGCGKKIWLHNEYFICGKKYKYIKIKYCDKCKNDPFITELGRQEKISIMEFSE